MRWLEVFVHEVNWLLRHKGALMILIAAPVIYAIVYPLPFKNAVVTEVPIIVWDGSNSKQTQNWIRELDAGNKLEVIAVMPGQPNISDWKEYPDVKAFIYFPPDLERRLSKNQQVLISYGGSAENMLVYSTSMKSIANYFKQKSAELSLVNLYELEANSITALAYNEPVSVEIKQLFNEQSSYLQYLVPGVFILILQQVLLMTLGMQWAYQFEMKRDIPDPTRQFSVQLALYYLHGIALLFFFFKIVLPLQGILIQASSMQLLQVATPFIISIVAFGTICSLWFKEQETAIIWFLCLSVPFYLVSGASWPKFAMSPWVISIFKLVPTSWGIDAIIQTVFLGKTPDLINNWLVTFTLVAFAWAGRVLRVTAYKSEEKNQSTV